MKRKSLVLIATAVMMMAALVVGGTLAYFTDTDSATNTFEAGKVGISLDEAVVVVDEETDNLVADGDKRTSDVQNYKLHPGQVVTKDPTIHVDEDSLDTYVGAVIKVSGDLYDLIGVEGYPNIDVHKLASGGLLADEAQATTWNGLWGYMTDKCFIYQDVVTEGNLWVMYIFMLDEQAAGSDVVLFDTLTIPASYDNAEMAKLDTMQIDVNAFATQTEGFADCYQALTSAFPGQFKFN